MMTSSTFFDSLTENLLFNINVKDKVNRKTPKKLTVTVTSKRQLEAADDIDNHKK
jgi:hypothetical protein